MLPTPRSRPRHTRRTHARLTRWPGVLALLIASTAVLPAQAAHALDSTTCTGSASVVYSPGLTFTPRTVTFTETDTYSTCLSTDPTLTSGSSVNTVSLAGASCLGAGPGTATYTINWNNSQSSTLALSYTDVIAGGVETLIGTGTVTSGQFTGGTALVTIVLTAPNPLQCLTTTGATGQSGVITAEIINI